ncbi:hypothetical protein Q0Z83_107740 [Actinoplanes sichuanensis]|nr:hypothetical protein Q0Z83_107740 [Actinoplanes sichuanensis]
MVINHRFTPAFRSGGPERPVPQPAVDTPRSAEWYGTAVTRVHKFAAKRGGGPKASESEGGSVGVGRRRAREGRNGF